MAWSFTLADLAGNALGEVRDASGRGVKVQLNRFATARFTIRADNAIAPTVLELDEVLLKAYDNASGAKVLRFLGPLIGYQKSRDASGGSIAVNAMGVGWRASHRLVGKSLDGLSIGTALSPVDRGEIARQILVAINADRDTGIRTGSIATSSATYVGPYRYKPADEAWAELSAALDGYDYEIAPTEPTADGSGLQLGLLNIAAIIGSTKPDVVWEFGTGKNNVESWSDVGDATSLANQAYNLPQGFPDNATQAVLSSTDAGSIAERGLHEAVVPGDLVVDQLRQKITDENVRIRKTPRRVISFVPIAEDADTVAIDKRRVPRAFVDYIAGDIVRFRAVERFEVRDPTTGAVTDYEEQKTVDALLRVFSIDLSIDELGTAKPALSLVEDS